MYPHEFDDIRPYSEEELPLALQRLVECPDFDTVCGIAFKDKSLEEMRRTILAIRTIDEFQMGIMQPVIEFIKDKTISRLSSSFGAPLDPATPYLFVSNHRDIVLDAFLLQLILHHKSLPTAQITFGANLMKHPLVVEIGRINKMFRVERGGSLRSFYTSMAKVSAYMRYVITQRHESVWIAQRNGRTKNGIDATEPSLLKMFANSGNPKDLVDNIAQLHIVPVSVSYEWEPCDWLKARELFMTVDGVYHKAENEDLNSIVTGIMQPKGNVHFNICKMVSRDDLEAYDASSDGDFFKWLANLVDSRIISGYKLTPNNYIAHDLREQSQRFASHYSFEERDRFLAHVDDCIKKAGCDIRTLLLDIYANPVDR